MAHDAVMATRTRLRKAPKGDEPEHHGLEDDTSVMANTERPRHLNLLHQALLKASKGAPINMLTKSSALE